MSERSTQFAIGEFYHIYNRGNSKQIIFKDDQDYRRFIGLLYACNSSQNFRTFGLRFEKTFFDFKKEDCLVAIGAYVLMPNHFHILLTPLVDQGVSTFMKKLCTAYSMYFNKKYSRSGSLFEGKFKSSYAGEDRYLKYLFSYIHLNPIKMIDPTWKEFGITNKKEALEYLNTYTYSSYLDFKNVLRAENSILDLKHFPRYFPSKALFEKEIISWFTKND